MCGVIVMNSNLEIEFRLVINHTIHRTKNQHMDIFVLALKENIK